MDIHQLKQRIDALGKKLVMLGNEYIKSKDEIAVRKVLLKSLMLWSSAILWFVAPLVNLLYIRENS